MRQSLTLPEVQAQLHLRRITARRPSKRLEWPMVKIDRRRLVTSPEGCPRQWRQPCTEQMYPLTTRVEVHYRGQRT
jgi:hypothetical protein